MRDDATVLPTPIQYPTPTQHRRVKCTPTQPFGRVYSAPLSGELRIWFLVNTFVKEQSRTRGALLGPPRRPPGATPAVSQQTRFLPAAPEPPGLPCPLLTRNPTSFTCHTDDQASAASTTVPFLLHASPRQPLQTQRPCSRRTGDPQPHPDPVIVHHRHPSGLHAPAALARGLHATTQPAFTRSAAPPPLSEAALFNADLSSRLYQRSSNTTRPPASPAPAAPARVLSLRPRALSCA